MTARKSSADAIAAKAAALKARAGAPAAATPAGPAAPEEVRDSVGPALRDDVPPQIRNSVLAEVRASGTTEGSTSATTEVRDSVSQEVSSSVDEEVSDSVSPQARTKRVRLSVDIWPDEYTRLKRLADAAAADLGVLRVPHQEVTSTLLRMFVNQPELQRRVLDEIRRARRGR